MLRELMAERVRLVLGHQDDVWESEVMEGRAFWVSGHVAVCITHEGDLLVRTTSASRHVSKDGSGPVTALVTQGLRSRSWLRIHPIALTDPAELRSWVAIGAAVSRSLPPGSI